MLAALETVPAAQRASETFQKAMKIMGHVVAARRMWLFRFGTAATRPDSLIPLQLGDHHRVHVQPGNDDN